MKPKRAIRGYTAVELMLSLSVLAIGAAGIVTMQRVTAESNRHAKALVTATHIAQSCLDQLTAESSQWTTSGDFTNTHWLGQIVGNTVTTDWFRPGYYQAFGLSPAFNFQGTPVDPTKNDAAYCVDMRLQWLYREADDKASPAVPGSGLLRAEVRVIWLNDNSVTLATSTANGACGWSTNEVTNNAESPRAFHFLYMSTAVLQHDQI